MASRNHVRVGGLAAVVTGGLLLILDVWGLLLEMLGAYPENFSEEALTTTYTFQSALRLIGALLLLVAVVGLHPRQSEAAGAWDSLPFSQPSSVLGCSWVCSGPMPLYLQLWLSRLPPFSTPRTRDLWPSGSSSRPQYLA